MNEIDKLAGYIIQAIPGEPSRSEGAAATALRLLRKYRAALLAIRRDLREAGSLSAGARNALDEAAWALSHPSKLKRTAC